MRMRMLAIVAAAGLVSTLVGAPARAVTNAPFRWGFVWADQPTTPMYTPSMLYQANSAGEVNTIRRTGTGVYVVTFPRLGWPLTPPSQGAGGNVQVTAYSGTDGDDSARCKVATWESDGTNLRVTVLCFTAAGMAVDRMYTVLYQADELPGGNDGGYARVTAAGGAPAQFQVNSSGLGVLNTVTHTAGSGLYRVRLPGLARPGGNVQVTAYGPGPVHCKARSLSHDDDPVEAVVVVGCHNPAGTLTDAAFSVAYTNNEVPNRRHGAYARADAGGDVVPSDQFSTTGGVVVSLRDTGVYDVVLSGMPDLDDTNVIVTAYGSGATTCKVRHWLRTAPAGTTVTVRCFVRTAAGAEVAVNHPFSLLYTTNLVI